MKGWKNVFLFLLMIAFSLSLAACGASSGGTGEQGGGSQIAGGGNSDGDNGENGDGTDETPAPPDQNAKALVAYFSCTNTTKQVAENLQAQTQSEIYRIVPADPYTADDLNYGDGSCRANREQNDESARPAISGSVENMSQYDVIFVGYPIWWGQAPKIIYTFIESYDFSGKTIIPFCTSGGSAMGTSATNLHALASAASWKSGRLVRTSTMQSDISALINMI